jgi:hypothetical protein
MGQSDNIEAATENAVVSNTKPNGSAPMNQWQFSLRSLFKLVTVWALFLSVTAIIPGLGDLPFVIAFLAVITSAFFGLGCLLGWTANQYSRKSGNGPNGP